MENKTALIVDDDEDIRIALQTALEDERYTVFSAANGQEALEMLEEIPKPCVILLDLMMPVLDGWEFLKIREKQSKLASIPVVAVSAFSDQAKRVKADGFIKKPIEFKSLATTLNRFCA